MTELAKKNALLIKDLNSTNKMADTIAMVQKGQLITKILSALTLILGLPLSAQADIWRCGKSLYTTTERPGANCELIPASVLCGSDGNKYITPGDENYDAIVKLCPRTGKSKSIFGEAEKLSPEQQEAKKLDMAKNKFKKTSAKNKNKKITPQDLATASPESLMERILKDPTSLSELAKFVFPSLQEDFSD
jgi:hypothetical protein